MNEQQQLNLEWKLIAEGLNWWRAYNEGVIVGEVQKLESGWLARWEDVDGYIVSQPGFVTSDDAKAVVKANIMRVMRTEVKHVQTRDYFVDGPHGEMYVNASSKADAVNEYARECGYKTIGQPEFVSGNLWVDRKDGNAKYYVETAEEAIDRMIYRPNR